MAAQYKLFQQTWAGFLGLMIFSASPVNAAFVSASSEMTVNNLSFVIGDTVSQFQWTDVWQGLVTAHAADSDSSSADQNNLIFGNAAAIQALANSVDVSSTANYSVVSGDQIGLSPGAGVSGATQSSLTLAGAFKQADGFAVSSFNDFFMLTNPNDPTAQGPVALTFFAQLPRSYFRKRRCRRFFQ